MIKKSMNIIQNLPDNYSKISYSLLCLAAGTIPFTRFLMLPIFFALALTWLFMHPWKNTWRYYTQQKLWIPLCTYCIFFIFIVIGTLYSQNTAKAIADWECKVWFLGAPLFLFPLLPFLHKKNWISLLILFVMSNLAVSIGNIVWSAAIFAQTGDKMQFFYKNASHFFGSAPTHPSYLAMYACFSWLICAELLRKKLLAEHKTLKIIFIAALIIFPIEIMLLQSKAGIIAFGIALLWGMVLFLNNRQKRPIITVFAIAAFVPIFAFLTTFPRATNRINESISTLQHGNKNNPSDGTTQRVIIWQTALELSIENMPFGVGTGDVLETLQNAYRPKGYTYMYQRKLNCHNQYLETTLGLGIFGLLALLIWLVVPFYSAIKKKDALLLGFVIIVAMNMLVESMLETRAGSNFIPLFTILLWLSHPTKQTEEDLA